LHVGFIPVLIVSFSITGLTIAALNLFWRGDPCCWLNSAIVIDGCAPIGWVMLLCAAIASTLDCYGCYCFKPGLLAAASSLILAVKCCYCCISFVSYVMMVVTALVLAPRWLRLPRSAAAAAASAVQRLLMLCKGC
jgi:hypothetical protein